MSKNVPLTLTALFILASITAAVALSHSAHHEAPVPSTHPIALTSAPKPLAVSAVTKKTADDDDGDKEDDGDKKDKEDDAPLTAAITPKDATSAALRAQPGTAGKVELENEDGKAVYGVAVTAADGKKYDVKVDANKGNVLKSEADDEDEHESKEAKEEQGEKED